MSSRSSKIRDQESTGKGGGAMIIKVILVLGLCVVLLFSFVGCASRDTHYYYGQTSFVSLAGSSRIGEVIFNRSDEAADDIYVKVPSGKVLAFKAITAEDVGVECDAGDNGRIECSDGGFWFVFIDGSLLYAKGRNHNNCRFSFSHSKNGPFITFPMSVKQVTQAFGNPQKISSNPTKLR